jgi:NADPH:quinone reductase-like Zn-dependent oxidoreductase
VRLDNFASGGVRYDLILDTGGNSMLSRLRRARTPRGSLVIVGGEGGGRLTGMGRQLRVADKRRQGERKLVIAVSSTLSAVAVLL